MKNLFHRNQSFSSEQTAIRRFVILVSLIGFIGTTVLTFISVLNRDIAQIVINGVSATCLVITLFTALLGFIGFGRVTVPFVALLSIGSLTATGNGLHEPSIFAFAIVIATASLLLGQTGLIVYGVLTAITILGINYASLLGILPFTPIMLSEMIKTMIAVAATTLVSFIGTRQLQQSLQETRRNELAQIQVNRELEKTQASLTARTKALATSVEVSRRLSMIFNQKELVTGVVNQVNNAFGYYHTQIYFYDVTNENLVMAGGTGEAGEMMLAQFHKVAKGRGLVGRSAETNATVLVSDTSKDPDWLPNSLLPKTKSEIAVPIAIGDQVMGVLDVQHDIIDGLRQEDVDALQAVASQVAVAIQNIRQYEKTQKIAADMGVVANVGLAISTITESGQLLQEVVDLSKKSFNLYHAHIYLLNEVGDSLELAAGAGDVGRQMVSKKHSIAFDREQSLVARAARTHEGVVVNDVTTAPDFLPNPLLPDTRSEMAVPMLVAGKVIGVLDVQSEIVNRFTDVDVSIQTTLASQVAVALQNARSFSQAQRQATRETAVNLITQKIQSATTVEAALQIAARELGHALSTRTSVQVEPATDYKEPKTPVEEGAS